MKNLAHRNARLLKRVRAAKAETHQLVNDIMHWNDTHPGQQITDNLAWLIRFRVALDRVCEHLDRPSGQAEPAIPIESVLQS